jgi:hypothetical protein
MKQSSFLVMSATKIEMWRPRGGKGVGLRVGRRRGEPVRRRATRP